MPNIGTTARTEPNERSRKLTEMLLTMVGTWTGEYSYYDGRKRDYVQGTGTLVFQTTPMPNVLTLNASSERPSGPPVHAFTTMVMQADGASWRQMAFTETDGRIQDKVITGYSYEDDANWTIDMLEVQQDFGAASVVTVKMVIKEGALDMRKFRSLEGGEAAARPYESRAIFTRVS